MKHLIEIAWEWGLRCFGWEHMNNHRIRSLRATEEVIELGQALGVPEDVVHLLVTKIYQRPAGDAYQEIGGSMITLMALCRSMNIDPEEAFAVEIRRVLSKGDPAHFAKRNQDKIDLGLDA